MIRITLLQSSRPRAPRVLHSHLGAPWGCSAALCSTGDEPTGLAAAFTVAPPAVIPAAPARRSGDEEAATEGQGGQGCLAAAIATVAEFGRVFQQWS